MIINLVIKNIKNSFKNFRKIYLLLIVSQLVSIVSIFFVYGIFASYSEKMTELDMDSYIVNVSFTESTVGELKECLPEILEQIEPKLDYLFVSSGSGNGTMVAMYTEYHDGEYVLKASVKEKNLIREGRTLSDEDVEKESKVLYSLCPEENKVGDIVNIAGVEFEVIGVDIENLEGYIIPFNVCPDNSKLYYLSVVFEKLPTQKDYNLIKETLEGTFGINCEIDEFDVKDEEQIISYRTNMIISIAICVISALNTCLLYGYIVSQRRKQMAVYGIIGASQGRILAINEIEIMLVSALTTFAGLAIFKLGLENVITSIYEESTALYSVQAYLIMTAGYIISIFVFTFILLHIMNRDKLVDMLRRKGND